MSRKNNMLTIFLVLFLSGFGYSLDLGGIEKTSLNNEAASSSYFFDGNFEVSSNELTEFDGYEKNIGSNSSGFGDGHGIIVFKGFKLDSLDIQNSRFLSGKGFSELKVSKNSAGEIIGAEINVYYRENSGDMRKHLSIVSTGKVKGTSQKNMDGHGIIHFNFNNSESVLEFEAVILKQITD